MTLYMWSYHLILKRIKAISHTFMLQRLLLNILVVKYEGSHKKDINGKVGFSKCANLSSGGKVKMRGVKMS